MSTRSQIECLNEYLIGGFESALEHIPPGASDQEKCPAGKYAHGPALFALLEGEKRWWVRRPNASFGWQTFVCGGVASLSRVGGVY